MPTLTPEEILTDALKAMGTGDFGTQLAKVVDVNKTSPDGTTLVFKAAEAEDTVALKALVARGVNLSDVRNSTGQSLADIAATKGSTVLLGFLAEQGVNLTEALDGASGEAKRFIEERLTFQAAEAEDTAALKAFVTRGVNLSDVRNSTGQSLVDIAATKRSTVLLGFLAKQGVDLTAALAGASDAARDFIAKWQSRQALKAELLSQLEPLEKKIGASGRLQTYQHAFREAKDIVTTLKAAVENYCSDLGQSDTAFRESCLSAVSDDKTEHLRQHRDTLGYVFAGIKNFFVILWKSIRSENTGNIQFFDSRTDSAKRIGDLKGVLGGMRNSDTNSSPDPDALVARKP